MNRVKFLSFAPLSHRTREILSDVLITLGVFALLFCAWYEWLGDVVAGIRQDTASQKLAQSWATTRELPEFDRETGDSTGTVVGTTPPVTRTPGIGKAFATLIVPRFGKNYERSIAESVDVAKVLNNMDTGVGHYVTSDALGEVGNFALAGHRTTYGAAFGSIDTLRVGDRIYLETEKGWYIYRFRNMEWSYSSDSTVLNPVPQLSISAKQRILTMTTCHPKLSSAERFIAFSVFENFVPRKDGMPSEVAALRTR
jgi:sortase A